MSDKKAAIAILGIVGGVGVLLWWSRSRAIAASPAPGGGVTIAQTPPANDPAGANGPGGPSTNQVIGTTLSTVGTVAGILGGVGSAAAVTAPAAVGAAGAAVGGSTVAGSVAAASEATAAVGATTPAGAAVAGGGVGLGTVALVSGIGAAFAVGYFIWRANRNDTKEDREDFVESLGTITVNGVPYVLKSDATGTQFDHLHAAMLAVDPVIGEQLWIEATQQIGKKDRTRNVAWMHKVLQLFGLENTPAVQQGLPYDAPFDDEVEDVKDDTGLYELLN